jgi:tRNA pseudouridine55 synthase
MGGLVLLDKPEGVSSFQCLGPVKRALGSRRVGHVGTLDPFASGLLGVVTQRATRLAPLLNGLEKRYQAVIRFGVETDTLDPEGNVVREAPVPDLARIRQALPSLTGRLRQRPPKFSAVQVGGERAYAMARRGREPDLPLREVAVTAVDLVHWREPELTLSLTGSAGMYVRSWARDLGLAAGSCAYVVQLRRVAIGPFGNDEALAPDQFQPQHVLPPAAFLSRLPGVRRLRVRTRFRHCLVHGQPIGAEMFAAVPAQDAGPYAVFDADECLLAVLRRSPDGWSYVGVFA